MLSKTCGENVDDCHIIEIAPTGEAAYSVKGATIHAVLDIPAQQK